MINTVSAYTFVRILSNRREQTSLGSKKKLMGQSSISQHEIEHIIWCILPDILTYYESEENQRNFRGGWLSVMRDRWKDRSVEAKKLLTEVSPTWLHFALVC